MALEEKTQSTKLGQRQRQRAPSLACSCRENRDQVRKEQSALVLVIAHLVLPATWFEHRSPF
jgi:hypothetical protein